MMGEVILKAVELAERMRGQHYHAASSRRTIEEGGLFLETCGCGARRLVSVSNDGSISEDSWRHPNGEFA